MRTMMAMMFVAALGCHGGSGGSSNADLAAPADLTTPADLTPALVSIVVSPSTPKILIGDTPAFTAMASYSDGSTQDVTATVIWSSTDSGVATIAAGGHANGVGKGTTSITASLDGVSSAAVPLAVRSVDALVLSWSNAPALATVTHASATPYPFTATAQLSDGDTLDVTSNASTTWTALPAGNRVTMIPNGLAYPGTDTGISDITATFAGKSAMTQIWVM